MRGESRFDILEEFGIKNTLLASTSGKLLDLGRFPGMIRGSGFVMGERIRVNNIHAALEVLDQVEGYRGEGREGSLYTRQLVDVDVGANSGPIGVGLLYHRHPDLRRIIPSGDWRVHRNTQDEFLDKLIRKHWSGSEQDLAMAIAKKSFTMATDHARIAKSLLPIRKAIKEQRITERDLVFVSKKFVVTP